MNKKEQYGDCNEFDTQWKPLSTFCARQTIPFARLSGDISMRTNPAPQVRGLKQGQGRTQLTLSSSLVWTPALPLRFSKLLALLSVCCKAKWSPPWSRHTWSWHRSKFSSAAPDKMTVCMRSLCEIHLPPFGSVSRWNRMPDNMSEDTPGKMSKRQSTCQSKCQNLCQVTCQKICQIKCQKIRQAKRQNTCQGSKCHGGDHSRWNIFYIWKKSRNVGLRLNPTKNLLRVLSSGPWSLGINGTKVTHFYAGPIQILFIFCLREILRDTLARAMWRTFLIIFSEHGTRTRCHPICANHLMYTVYMNLLPAQNECVKQAICRQTAGK